MSHKCNVCDATPTVSRCVQCNFHFCIQHASFMHLCSEDHITRKLQTSSQKQVREAHLGGIGAWLNKLDDVVTVNALVENGPAHVSKQLFVGDVVLQIEGKDAASLPSCQDVILGVPGTPVTLLVRRGSQVFNVRIIRDVKNAPTRLDHMEVREVEDVSGVEEMRQTTHYSYQSGQVVTDREAHFVAVSPVPNAGARPISPALGTTTGPHADEKYTTRVETFTTTFRPVSNNSATSASSASGGGFTPRTTSTTPRNSNSNSGSMRLAGIGVVLSRSGNIVRVESILPDGPADRVLRVGDAVLQVNGVPAAALPSCQDALIGPPGTLVNLGIDRPNVGYFTCEIVRMRPIVADGDNGFVFAPPPSQGQQQQQQQQQAQQYSAAAAPHISSIAPYSSGPGVGFEAQAALQQQLQRNSNTGVVSFAPNNNHNNNSNTNNNVANSNNTNSYNFSSSASNNQQQKFAGVLSYAATNSSARAGIGAIFVHTPDGRVIVERLRAGGPASVHLCSGDEVLSINGVPARGMQSCQEVVMGPAGTTVVMVVDRPGVGRLERRVVRAV